MMTRIPLDVVISYDDVELDEVSFLLKLTREDTESSNEHITEDSLPFFWAPLKYGCYFKRRNHMRHDFSTSSTAIVKLSAAQ